MYRKIRPVAVAAAVLALTFSLAAATVPARAAQAPASLTAILKELAVWDGGIDSAALWKLRDAVWAAKDVPAARAECEARLLAFLAGRATPVAKMAVAKHIRTIGSEKAVPALEPLLLDKTLSDTAIYALAKIPSPAVDKAYIRALARAEGAVKTSLIAVLGDRRAAEAVAVLAPLLADRQGAYAGSAALALGSIGNAESAKALTAAYAGLRPELKPLAAASILHCAEGLRAARDSGAAAGLYDKLLAETALPATLREGAMIGKIRVAGERAPGLLIDQLKGADPVFQAAAIAVLRDIIKPDAVGPICDLLPGRPEGVQVQILAALAEYPREKVLPTILQAARGASAPVRLAALKALESAGDATTVRFLAESAAKAKGGEQVAARAALAGMKGREVDDAVTATLREGTDPAIQAECLQALGQRLSYPAKSVVVPFLASPNPALRIQAARVIKVIGTPSDIYAVLETYLKAGDDAERLEAAGTVTALTQKIAQIDGRSNAVKARLADEKNPAAKARLLDLLGRIGDDSALPAVRAAANDADAGVAEAAVRALAAWPTAAARFDALALARSGKTETLRLLALQGFIRMTGSEKYAPAANATASLKEAAGLAVRPEERKLILGLLPGFACAESLALAESLAADPAVKAEAQAAVTKIKEKLASK
ncbi:MAG: hypothetical protein NTZ26_06635 [Candidatus Aminicenantes bacterium]|nr:hypothetical protein [Candidatus Aminicenantes bacterium]